VKVPLFGGGASPGCEGNEFLDASARDGGALTAPAISGKSLAHAGRIQVRIVESFDSLLRPQNYELFLTSFIALRSQFAIAIEEKEIRETCTLYV